jgi:diguanylate cyclase (GGDEF)-like protein
VSLPSSDIALFPVSYDPWVVLRSVLIACFASYVALDLAKRVRTPDRALALGWWAGGSLAMGTGIWAMHFVGMLALSLPLELGYGYIATALSWVAAVGVSAIALSIASHASLRLWPLAGGALAMGGGICVMHYTGMAALDMAPAIRWNGWLVAASAAIAVAASAVALVIFFWLQGVGERGARWQALAAVAMGAAIAGMHYTGMAAAGFAEGALCLSTGQLRGHSLGLLVSVASVALLTLTMVGSALDARMQRKAGELAARLHTAHTELQQLAWRDALTGLPNRQHFDALVAAAVARHGGGMLAVLLVDLDGFKPLNDSFGHAFGDAVLRVVALRLAEHQRTGVAVARLGGDEFVLLLEGAPDLSVAARLAQRVIDAVQVPLQVPVQQHGHEMRLSCSVGITVYPADGAADQLLAHADAAMRAAKRAGGGASAFFEPHMNSDQREQIELQRDLRQALDGGQLELHYQPKVRAIDGTLTGVEALVRWRHPVRGMLSPALFIPVAERFGLIGALGDWVMHEACRQIDDWRRSGLRLHVAVNLSVHQLRQEDLVPRVERLLQQYALEAELLSFEITESVAMDDAEATRSAFESLGRLGVKLAIDDFGTGYSSLSYLRRLRASQLKIDRSFVQDLDASADARAIVEAVVRLAHALGLNVVAEGVETVAQRDVLRALGCDELQGYLFARPMPPQALHAWALQARLRVGAPAGEVALA